MGDNSLLLLNRYCDEYRTKLSENAELNEIEKAPFLKVVDNLIALLKKTPPNIIAIAKYLFALPNDEGPQSLYYFLIEKAVFGIQNNQVLNEKARWKKGVIGFILECPQNVSFVDNTIIALFKHINDKYFDYLTDSSLNNIFSFLSNQTNGKEIKEIVTLFSILESNPEYDQIKIDEVSFSLLTRDFAIFEDWLPIFRFTQEKNFKFVAADFLPYQYTQRSLDDLYYCLICLEEKGLLTNEHVKSLLKEFNNKNNIEVIANLFRKMRDFDLLTLEFVQGMIAHSSTPYDYLNSFIKTINYPTSILYKNDSDLKTLDGQSSHMGFVFFPSHVESIFKYYEKKYHFPIRKARSDDEIKMYMQEIKKAYKDEDNVRIPIFCGLGRGFERGYHMTALIYIKENGKEGWYYSDSQGTHSAQINNLLKDETIPFFYIPLGDNSRQASRFGCFDDTLAAINEICKKNVDGNYRMPGLLSFFESHSHSQSENKNAKILKKLPDPLLKTSQLSAYRNSFEITSGDEKASTNREKHNSKFQRKNLVKDKEKTCSTYLYYRSIKAAQLVMIERKIVTLTPQLQNIFHKEVREKCPSFIKNQPGAIRSDPAFEQELDSLFLDFSKRNGLN
jgi:hypothetical protein